MNRGIYLSTYFDVGAHQKIYHLFLSCGIYRGPIKEMLELRFFTYNIFWNGRLGRWLAYLIRQDFKMRKSNWTLMKKIQLHFYFNLTHPHCSMPFLIFAFCESWKSRRRSSLFSRDANKESLVSGLMVRRN